MKYYHMMVSEQGQFAFVPAERGRWIKTHMSAMFVDCENKMCKAKKKTPCISLAKLASFDRRVFQVAVHPERIKAYQKWKKENEIKVNEEGKIVKMKRGRKRA